MIIKRRKRRVFKRKAKAYQVVVREGSAAPRPLKGMRMFNAKTEALIALRMLRAYEDENTRMSLRTVR